MISTIARQIKTLKSQKNCGVSKGIKNDVLEESGTYICQYNGRRIGVVDIILCTSIHQHNLTMSVKLSESDLNHLGKHLLHNEGFDEPAHSRHFNGVAVEDARGRRPIERVYQVRHSTEGGGGGGAARFDCCTEKI